jgi:hypothetical protein
VCRCCRLAHLAFFKIHGLRYYFLWYLYMQRRIRETVCQRFNLARINPQIVFNGRLRELSMFEQIHQKTQRSQLFVLRYLFYCEKQFIG